MSCNQERVSNRMVKLEYCPLSQVPYKIIVFVLTRAVIGVKMEMFLQIHDFRNNDVHNL